MPVSLTCRTVPAFPVRQAGRLPHHNVSRPAQRSLALRPAWLLSRPWRPVPSECFNRGRYLPQPLRLLPAGATVAGRDSHPLGKGASHGALSQSCWQRGDGSGVTQVDKRRQGLERFTGRSIAVRPASVLRTSADAARPGGISPGRDLFTTDAGLVAIPQVSARGMCPRAVPRCGHASCAAGDGGTLRCEPLRDGRRSCAMREHAVTRRNSCAARET